jgi:DNA-binding MarR family transcriptional regulator
VAVPSADEASHAVDALIDVGTDLMFRFLVDRDAMSASAGLVINRLFREGPMRLTALAEAEGSSQSGMTQLVQRMERQGLLERWSDPDDGRASLVKIGAAGRQLWDARLDTRRRRIAGLLADLPEDDRMALWLAAEVAARLLRDVRQIADSRSRAHTGD